MTKIVLKHGAGVPTGSDLEVAEVAIDNVSGAMYTKLSDDSVKQLNPEGGAGSWNDLTDKPTEYPPEAHTQDWNTITNTPADYPPSAHGHAWGEITGKPSEFPPASHNHDGVYQPIGDYIEDADSDGKQYARQDGTWSEIVIPEESNTLEGTWAYNSSSASEGSFTTRNASWLTAVTITLHKTDSTGFEHNFALMADGDIIYLQASAGGAEYSVVSKTVSGDTCDFTVDLISSYGTFPDDGQSVKINFIPQVSSGSSVHIGALPPDAPLEGQQWMEVPADGDAAMWIYDGGKWLQQPGGKDGANGANGADGKDGVDGLWTDNGDTSISYTAGNVGIGTDDPQAVFQVVDNNPIAFSATADADTNMPGMRLRNNAGGNTWSGVWFQNGSHWSGIAGAKSGDNWATHLSFFTHGEATSGLTQATERMRIESSGQTRFFNDSGLLGWFDGTGLVLQRNDDYLPYLAFRNKEDTKGSIYGRTDTGVDIWTATQKMFSVNDSGITSSGNIYKNGGTPVMATSDMVKAFSKLRDAVRDEETVESLKESITNCIGGLIEEWEAMQSAATQEISDE